MAVWQRSSPAGMKGCLHALVFWSWHARCEERCTCQVATSIIDCKIVAQPDLAITLDTLHLVFSAFGLVQKIATFEKGQGFQALVQYADPNTAEQVASQSGVNYHMPYFATAELARPASRCSMGTLCPHKAAQPTQTMPPRSSSP